MKIYQLKTVQNLPIGIEEAWEFFSNPNNLSVITPEWLNFKVTSKLPDKMYAGMITPYKFHPVLGIPNTWVTEITHIKEPFYFVDAKIWRVSSLTVTASGCGVKRLYCMRPAIRSQEVEP